MMDFRILISKILYTDNYKFARRRTKMFAKGEFFGITMMNLNS